MQKDKSVSVILESKGGSSASTICEFLSKDERVSSFQELSPRIISVELKLPNEREALKIFVGDIAKYAYVHKTSTYELLES